jgi:hypothetical protein
VLAPVLVSAAMIAAGVWHLRRAANGEPVGIRGVQWGGIILGAVVIVISFAMDYRNLMAGGMPNPFSWGVFSTGLLVGIGSYAWSARATQRADQNVIAPMQSAEAAQ